MGVVRIYDMTTLGPLLFQKQLHQGDVTCISYAQQSDAQGCILLATAGVDSRVQILALSNNTYVPVQRISVGQHPISAMHLSADGLRMVVCLHNTAVTFWKNTGNPQYFVEHNYQIPSKQPQLAVAVARHGYAAVTLGGDRRLRVWDMQHGVLVKTPHLEKALAGAGQVVAMCGDAAGRVVVVADALCMLYVVDVTTGLVLAMGASAVGRVAQLAMSLDGKSVVGTGVDGCVVVWGLPASVVAVVGGVEVCDDKVCDRGCLHVCCVVCHVECFGSCIRYVSLMLCVGQLYQIC